MEDKSRCEMCTGNTVKTKPGNAENFDDDPPCDGVATVPSTSHTACGGLAIIVCRIRNSRD